MSRKNILITGCSDGGLGASLARAFHAAGLRVIATARNASKMSSLSKLGIETLSLDVCSETSIAACVSEVTTLLSGKGGLDYLLNNAGGGYQSPTTDMSLPKLRQLFELNVFSCVAMTNAFLPLLLESNTKTIINQTSVAAGFPLAWQGAYNASKAAISMLGDVYRMELSGTYGVKVIELRTARVASQFYDNYAPDALSEGSLFENAKGLIDEYMRMSAKDEKPMDADDYARQVVMQVLKTNPPWRIWKGQGALLCWVLQYLPESMTHSMLKDARNIKGVEKLVKQGKKVQ